MRLGRIVPRGRLRRRLTIAFMLAAGLSAAALAAGSYLLVRDSRLDDSLDRSLEQARATLVLAATILNGTSDPAAADQLIAALERRAGFEAVVIADGEATSTSLSLGEAQVPDNLQTLVDGGGLAYERTEINGEHELIVGGKPFGSQAEVYLFFSEEQLYADLRELAIVLAAGTGVLVALAGIFGALLARRALRPVAQASAAAQSLAEGLLDTRLPVERQDEFGVWAASFNEMADALEEKIEELSEAQARERRFTSDVAHELRTPLTALVNEAALLRDQLDLMPPDARRAGELLVRDVARLRRLVDELLEISRLDAGRESVERTRVDVAQLVGSIIRARGWDSKVALAGARRGPRRRTRAGSSESSATSSRTPSSTAAARSRSGSRSTTGRRRSPWPTAGPASTPSTCRTSSTASTRQTRRARRAGPASAWRSPARTRGCSEAISRSRAPRGPAPASR